MTKAVYKRSGFCRSQREPVKLSLNFLQGKNRFMKKNTHQQSLKSGIDLSEHAYLVILLLLLLLL